jgi:hypothetical protein
MPPRKSSAIEPCITDRQAIINRMFGRADGRKVRLKQAGAKPQKLANINVQLQDSTMRLAILAAAQEAGVSISEWARAAFVAALANPEALKLPLSYSEREKIAAEARRVIELQRQQEREARKADRLKELAAKSQATKRERIVILSGSGRPVRPLARLQPN